MSAGKFKDHNKSAKDVSLGNVDSFSVKLTNNASNGTKVETSQTVSHENSNVLTKLALKFKKSDGLRLESFETASNGTMKGTAGFGGLAPGVDVSVGAERSEKKGAYTDSVFLNGTYTHDMAVVDGKLDVLARSLGLNALAQYQNVLIGGTAKFTQATPLDSFGVLVGYGCDDGNRVTVTMDKTKAFSLNSYFKPASGIEVSFLGNGAIKTADASKKDDKEEGESSKEGEKKEEAKTTTSVSFEATLAAAYALDNNGTSLTASLTTDAADYKKKLNVGASYTQKLRQWAELTISGEVGITNSEYVAFGAELSVGDL